MAETHTQHHSHPKRQQNVLSEITASVVLGVVTNSGLSILDNLGVSTCCTGSNTSGVMLLKPDHQKFIHTEENFNYNNVKT